MKLLTLNTHSWMEENMEAKCAALVERIVKQDYDLICLQEVNQLINTQPVSHPLHYQPLEGNPEIHEDNYALRLVEALAAKGKHYNWSWVYNHIGYDRFHEGVAILCQSSIEVVGVLASTTIIPEDYHTRRALLARTQIAGQSFSVVSLHLSWWEKGFEREWNRLSKALEAESSPLIIMGDFNNPTGNQGYQRVLNANLNLVDSHSIAESVRGDHTIEAAIDGWEGNQAALKVDHIFVDKSCHVNASRVVFDGEDGPVLSDHFGLEVDLTVKKS